MLNNCGLFMATLVMCAVACGPAEEPGALTGSRGERPTEEQDGPRASIRFFIGLGEAGGPDGDLTLTIPNDDGSSDTFRFDQAKADAQRSDAIKYGRGREGGYRDGRSYQLKDMRDRPLPVFWKPWAKEAVTEAPGGWVYVPDNWYRGRPGFTEADIVDAGAARTGSGQRSVVAHIAVPRQADFEAFTEEFINRALCILVDDEILTNPLLDEAITDEFQIVGGGEGFTEAEQKRLLRAMGGR